jgi:hypothetical protein
VIIVEGQKIERPEQKARVRSCFLQRVESYYDISHDHDAREKDCTLSSSMKSSRFLVYTVASSNQALKTSNQSFTKARNPSPHHPLPATFSSDLRISFLKNTSFKAASIGLGLGFQDRPYAAVFFHVEIIVFRLRCAFIRVPNPHKC